MNGQIPLGNAVTWANADGSDSGEHPAEVMPGTPAGRSDASDVVAYATVWRATRPQFVHGTVIDVDGPL